MKVKFLTIFLFFFYKQQSQVSLKIFFNIDNCSNCNNGLFLINKINPKVEKYFFTLEKTEPYINDIFNKYQSNISTFKIRYLINSYFDFSGIGIKNEGYESYCLLYLNGLKKDSFLLKNISEHINSINEQISSNENGHKNSEVPVFYMNKKTKLVSNFKDNLVIEIPDSIKLSTQVILTLRKNILNITDIFYNKNVTIFLNDKTLQIEHIIQFFGTNFKPKPFLDLNCFDTMQYRKCYPILKKHGSHITKIEGAFVTDTTINLLLNFTYPIINNPNYKYDSIFDMRFFLYTKNIKSSKRSLSCIRINEVNNKYWLNNSLPFYISNDKIYFSITNQQDTSNFENFLLVESDLNSNNFSSLVLVNNKAGALLNKKKSFGYVLNKHINDQFYFCTSFPYFKNYKLNYEFILNEKEFIDIINSSYFINDIRIDEERIIILITVNNDIQQIIFDFKTKKLLEKTDVFIDPKINRSFIRFYNNKNYRFLAVDNNKIYFIR